MTSVLVVDDDPALHDDLRKILTSAYAELKSGRLCADATRRGEAFA